MVKVKIQRGGRGEGMPKKLKGPHKSAAKEVSLKSPHLVFCAQKMVIAVDRLLLNYVSGIEIEKLAEGSVCRFAVVPKIL